MSKLLTIVVIAVAVIFFFQQNGCSYIQSFGPPKSDTVFKTDTAWRVHDSLIVKKVPVYKTLPPIHDTLPPMLIPDTNYAKLKAQYEHLLTQLYAMNIFVDTLRLDTLGYVSVTDTVQNNVLKNRAYSYKYKIPTITNTTTITNHAAPKRQMYVGGGINMNKTLGVEAINAGFLYKNRKDQIFGLNVGTTVNGGINYGFQSYWKIKLKK